MLRSALIAKLSTQKKKSDTKSPTKKTSLGTTKLKSRKKLILGSPKTGLKDNEQNTSIIRLGTPKKNLLVESPKEVSVKTPKLKSRRKSIIESNEIFDEEIKELGNKFRIDVIQVKKGIQGLITFTKENPKLKNNLFDDDQFPIFLQINSIKVPRGHPRIVRIPLKHTILTPDSEVCLIVADVKGIPNKDHEKHLEHYEKLLHQKDVDNIKKIMTFHEFRTEYETFELRNNLVELYDAFLVDGKIAGKTVKKAGKIFYKKRKIPTAIKLRASKLKEHIEQTLRKTPLYIHSKGDSFMVQIGHSKMGNDKLVENVFYIVKGLEKEFPGGFGNVRNLNLFAYRGITIPIYTTLKNQNEVVVSKNVKRSPPVEEASGELTTRLNSGVLVKSTGEVAVFKLKENNKKRKQGNIEENGGRPSHNIKQKRKKPDEDVDVPRKKLRKVEGGSNLIRQKKPAVKAKKVSVIRNKNK